MKKHGLILTLTLASLSLFSCDGGGEHRVNKGMKTVTYLVSNESEAYSNILNALIADFNESIKDEGYKIETQTPGGSYYQALGNKIASRNAPDIFQMEIGYFNAYSNSLLPLDDYLAKGVNGLTKDDLWDLNGFYKKDGKILSLIKDFSPDFMLIYNKTMLEEYNAAHPDKAFTIDKEKPMTWKEFYQMVSTVQGVHNVQYGTSLGFEGIKHLHEIVQKTGANVYKNDDSELNVEAQGLRDAFSYFCALQKNNATEFPEYYSLNQAGGRGPASYTSGATTSEQELFRQGRAFSIFNGLYSFAAYDFYNLPFEYGVAPAPVYKEGDSSYGTTSAMVSHSIYKGTRYPEIAYRFLSYYQTEGIKRFAKIGFNVPGNKTIAGSEAFLKNDNKKVEDLTNYFYKFVMDGHCHPTVYNSNVSFERIATIFNTEFAKYYDGKLSFDGLLGNISASIKASV